MPYGSPPFVHQQRLLLPEVRPVPTRGGCGDVARRRDDRAYWSAREPPTDAYGGDSPWARRASGLVLWRCSETAGDRAQEGGVRRMSTAMGPGTSFPLGATVRPHGVNFSVFSKSSTGVDLLLFNEVND